MSAAKRATPGSARDAESVSAELRARTAILAALLGGGAHALLLFAIFPGLRLWWLAPFAIAPLALVARVLARSTAMARLLGLAALWIVSLLPWVYFDRWVYDVSDAGFPAICALMASWTTLFVGLAARIRRRIRGGALGSGSVALATAIVFTGVEAFRAHVALDGYPWYQLAHPLIDAPWLSQSAEIWGVAPLSFLCALTGALVAEFVPLRRAPAAPRRPSTAAAIVLGAWILLLVGGWWRMGHLETRPGPLVIAIQTNLLSSNKTRATPEEQKEHFIQFGQQTLQALDEARAKGLSPGLVVWPETMLPGYGLEPDTLSLQRATKTYPGDMYSGALEEIVRRYKVPMLVGSDAYEGLRDDGEKWLWHRRFNSSYLLWGEPPYRRYDKLHLTPFGETMPHIHRWKALEDALMDFAARGLRMNLDAGTEAVVFTLPGGDRFVTPICFEDTLSPLCRTLVDGPEGKRADFIINLSNDGWFGTADDVRAAHELAARWRAIELRIGLLRAVNTGTSSFIDPWGRVVARAAPRTSTWLTIPTITSPVRTIFARTGDVASTLAMASTALLVIGTFLRRRNRAGGVAAFAPLGGGAVMSVMSVMSIMTTLIMVLPGCSAPPPKRSDPPSESSASVSPINAGSQAQVSPGAAGKELGLDTPTAQQSWSTREQSTSPGQEGASTSDRLARPAQPGVPVVSSGDLYQSSVELLQFASRPRYPVLAANAIEELTVDPAALRKVVGPALVSPNRGLRFVATMAIGKARLTDMANLVQPLLMDQSESVRAAAIFALVRLDQPVDQSPLARMVRSDDPEVRGNAIMILGELGNPSAIPLLRSTIGLGMTRTDPARRKITELQLAEALAKLGEDSELEPIRAALFSPSQQAEIIALACQIVARVHDGGAISTLQAIAYSGGAVARPPEIRLLAFIAIAELGGGDPSICLEFAQTFLGSKNPQLRALAVRALAGCGGTSELAAIEARLYDSDPMVQLAAAGSVVRLRSKGQFPTSR